MMAYAYDRKQNLGSDINIQSYRRIHVPNSPTPHFINQLMMKNSRQKKNEEGKKIITKQQQLIRKQVTFLKKKIMSHQTESEEELEKKVTFIHGNKIQGTWKKGNPHGHVKIEYETGEYFEGIYVDGVRKQGYVRFKDQTQYTGGFHKDIFNGYGTLKDPTGRIISCEWEEGQPKGNVQISYPSGEIYVGEVKKLKKHGQGHLFFKNGTKYVGTFVDGDIAGQGCFYENDKIVAEGIWKNGVLQVQQGIKSILSNLLQSFRFNSMSSEDSMPKPRKRKGKNSLIF